MACSGEELTGLWFDAQKYFAAASCGICEEKDRPVFDLADKWLDIYFSGTEPDFTPPFILNTTPFRKAVLDILLTIPYGETVAYGDIAKRISKQFNIPVMSAQAVGGAVAHNPISIIIPCHRVVGANGSLTGYAGGIDKKAALLALEKKVYNGRL